MNSKRGWFVIVTVDDEPPKPPVITGIVGPFYDEIDAEGWAIRKAIEQSDWIQKAHYAVMDSTKPY